MQETEGLLKIGPAFQLGKDQARRTEIEGSLGLDRIEAAHADEGEAPVEIGGNDGALQFGKSEGAMLPVEDLEVVAAGSHDLGDFDGIDQPPNSIEERAGLLGQAIEEGSCGNHRKVGLPYCNDLAHLNLAVKTAGDDRIIPSSYSALRGLRRRRKGFMAWKPRTVPERRPLPPKR